MPPIATGILIYAPSGDTHPEALARQLRERLQIALAPASIELICDPAPDETTLARASFLIPILTPAFLRDPASLQAVERFRTIAIARGRGPPILTVLGSDISAFQTGPERETCASPRTFAFLQSIRWHDVRALPQRDTALTGLTSEILGLLARDPATSNVTSDGPAFPPAIYLTLLLFAVLVGGSSLIGWLPHSVWSWSGPAFRGPLPQEIADCPNCPVMRLIPAGSFTMGTPGTDPRGFADERPPHKVTFAQPFYLGQTLVTVGEFKAFMRDHPSYNAGSEWNNPRLRQSDQHPVVDVNYFDIMAYIRWLNGKTGKHYRLPSEAEWAYAAHGGGPSPAAYPWGNRFEDGDGYLPPRGHGRTFPVETTKEYGYGLYDMLGNVWQWTADVWHENYEGAPTDGSAWMTGGTPARCPLRGGSWYSNAEDTRLAIREDADREYRVDIVGFRLARDAD